MEVYRPARADARGEAAGEPARCRGQGPRQDRGTNARRCRNPPHRLCRRRVRAGIVRHRRAGTRSDSGFARRRARRRRSGAYGKTRHAGAGERCRRRAQYRADGRRRGHPHRRRLDHRAAAASDLCRFGKARRELRALARRRRAGRAGHADREPRRPGRQRLSGQCGAGNGGRRRRPCRSRENHRRRRRRAARLDARRRRSAPGRASTPSPSPSAAPWCATSCF